MVDGATQLVDSRASDVLGQGSNSFIGEPVFPIVDEGEGALRVDDGDFRQLQDFGRHLEVNRGSKYFPVFKRVIGRGWSRWGKVGDEDDLAGGFIEVDSGGRHWRERMLTFLRLSIGLYPSNGCFT